MSFPSRVMVGFEFRVATLQRTRKPLEWLIINGVIFKAFFCRFYVRLLDLGHWLRSHQVMCLQHCSN